MSKEKIDIEEIKREVRAIIANMHNCLDDEFEKYFKSDIKNWLDAIINLHDKIIT